MNKKILLSVIIMAFALFAVPQARAQKSASNGFRVSIGDVAPDFEVETTDGKTIKLSELKGKVVVVNFWATWCPPCRAELKRVQAEIVDRFADKDFVFIAISRSESKSTVMDFRISNNYEFTMGLDRRSEIFDLFAEKGIPRNVVVGKDGRIAALEVGYSPSIFEGLIEEIEKALK